MRASNLRICSTHQVHCPPLGSREYTFDRLAAEMQIYRRGNKSCHLEIEYVPES